MIVDFSSSVCLSVEELSAFLLSESVPLGIVSLWIKDNSSVQMFSKQRAETVPINVTNSPIVLTESGMHTLGLVCNRD